MTNSPKNSTTPTKTSTEDEKEKPRFKSRRGYLQQLELEELEEELKEFRRKGFNTHAD